MPYVQISQGLTHSSSFLWGHFTLPASLLVVSLALYKFPELHVWEQPLKLGLQMVNSVRWLIIIAHTFSRCPSLTSAFLLCNWEELYEFARAARKSIWTPTWALENCTAKGLIRGTGCLSPRSPQDDCCPGNLWRTYSVLSRKTVKRNYNVFRPTCSCVGIKDTTLFHLIQVRGKVTQIPLYVLPEGNSDNLRSDSPPGAIFLTHQLHEELIFSPILHLRGIKWEQYRQYAPSTSWLFSLWLYTHTHKAEIFKKKGILHPWNILSYYGSFLG